MSRRNTLLLLIALAISPTGLLSAPDTNGMPISLEETINRAISNNLSIISLHYSLASSEVALQGRLNRFRLNIRPTIQSDRGEEGKTASARLTVSKDTPIGTAIALSAGSRRTEADEEDPLYRTSTYLEIQQPLLSRIGTRINLEPVRDARLGVLNSRRELALKQTDLIVQAAEAHESLLRFQREIQYQTKTIERLGKFLRLTSAREKQGRSTRVDTMRADLRVGNARLRMAALNDDLVREQTNFAELLGADPALRYSAIPSQLLILEIPSADDAVSSALSNRLDYAQIIDDHKNARRGVGIARQNMLPDLSVIARYELSGEGESYSDSSKLEDDVWFVGFRLASDLPLRDEKTALANAELTLGSTELRIESVTLAIKRQVHQAISAYRRILLESTLSEKNYSIAKNRARLARKLFQMGKGDSFSVSEAEDELLSAEQQLLSSQSDSSIASYKLKRVTGSLIDYPEDLKPAPSDK